MKIFPKKILSVLICVSMTIGICTTAFAKSTSSPQSVNGGLTDSQVIESEYENASATGQTDSDGLVSGVDYAEGEVLICAKPSALSSDAEVGDTDKTFEKKFDVTDGEVVSTDMDIPQEDVTDAVLYLAHTDEDVVDTCEEISDSSSVYFAQPNYAYEPCETSYTEPEEISTSSDYYNNQRWWMDMLDVNAAWEYTGGMMGQDVVVSVIDSGCNTAHSELQGHFWQYSKNPDVCGYYAYTNTWIKVGNTSLCYSAHGTHTCGSVAMADDGLGYLGTACESKLMVMKADRNDGGSFYSSEIIECVEKSVELGADVISMSYGSYNYDLASLLTYQKASKDAVLVAAAGNDKQDTTQRLHFPSAYSCIIGVMATGNSSNRNKLASFSNYDTTGNFYKVAAPGTEIYSCSNTDSDGYKVMSGTSMATPIVSGMVASYISYIRSLGYNWTAAQYQYMIENTVNESGNNDEVSAYSKSYQPQAYSHGSRFKLFNLLYLVKNGTSCPEAKEIAIDNEDLRNAVINATGLTKITDFDAERISYVDMSSLSVAAVKELCAKFPALEWFDVTGNSALKKYISETGADEFIKALPDTLVYLNLASISGLSDISAFADANFISLNYLDISSDVNIRDISALSKYTALKYLDISSTSVSDISAVGSMTYLETFRARYCNIYDASPIDGNTRMVSCDLTGNNITSVDAFTSYAGTKLILDNNYLSASYDPDYVSVLKKLLDRMKGMNVNSAVTLSYGSQKIVPVTYTRGVSITAQSDSVTVSRADFRSKRLDSLLGVSVVDAYGNPAKIYANVKWKGATLYLNENGSQITTDYAQLITGTRTVNFTASITDENGAAVSKTIAVTITAPSVSSASIINRSSCADSEYTFSVVTKYADRLLFTDGTNRLFEVSQDDASVIQNSDGTASWTVTVGRDKVSGIEKFYIYAGDSLGYSVGQSYDGTVLDVSGINTKTYYALSGLSHSYTLVSAQAATCTEAGHELYKCSVCGDEKIVELEPSGHSLTTTTVEPTCTQKGYKQSVCSICSQTLKGSYTAALGHSFVTTVVPATLTKNGSKKTECKTCGYISSSTVIYRPKTVSLSSTSYTYSGNIRKPTVTVKDSASNRILSSGNYTVSWSGDCKSVGKHTVTITFKGNYSGKITKTYKITSPITQISSLKAKSKGFTVKWKKTSQTTGYQIQYSTSSKFTSAKTITVTKSSTVSKTISKLKSNKKYYVRVRTYKTVSGVKYYSPWSAKKYIKTK